MSERGVVRDEEVMSVSEGAVVVGNGEVVDGEVVSVVEVGNEGAVESEVGSVVEEGRSEEGVEKVRSSVVVMVAHMMGMGLMSGLELIVVFYG